MKFNLNLFKKSPSEQSRKILFNRIKTGIQVFFDGSRFNIPEAGLPSLASMGITDLKMLSMSNSAITIEITLQRPGLLIGKGGSTLDRLRSYLSIMEDGKSIYVEVEESQIWKLER